MATPGQIQEVARHFVIACIWADCPEGTNPRAPMRAQRTAFDQCKTFIDRNLDLFNAAMSCASAGYGSHPDAGSAEAQFGHDLYLSARGHGTGFFDRKELSESLRDALQNAANKSGMSEPYFYRGWLYFQ